MAADVSARLRMMKDGGGDGKGQRDLITRDLLGGCDLGGQDRRLDLMPEKAYLERRGLHDLNLPPPPAAAIGTQAITEDSAALDLRLVSPSSSAAPEYQSVCTLEKVKSALERAEREARGRRRMSDGSPSPSSSTTSSSAKRRAAEAEEEEGLDGWDSSAETGMMAAGCPGCLLYVLISRRNPRCPRCDSHVPITAIPKKLKIDLNYTSP
ncbi:uncharacterized protein LOC120267853 [Dioscorea cayenensis subsp. rotundata]|uniref:Uncharacterized protein LOC120267853 n=1 Tax=Dioscorea cayennensis subsp. rotundata TaxID=55577 RepID=A0AB40BVI8_DIOCR|nr:uncharacterized protein LOC120267853 [Dioscorea cayenensis subsp. rotundata]